MVGEIDLYGVHIPAVGPGVTVLGPVVSHFHLAAFLIKALLKQAKAVAQAIAGQRNVAADSAIQEASSQATQAAVTQSIVLDVLQDGQIYATLPEQLLHLIQNAQVEQIGIYQPSNEVLCRNVEGFSAVLTGLLGIAPAVSHRHHHSFAQSLVQCLR